jgi:hypothetical protein
MDCAALECSTDFLLVSSFFARQDHPYGIAANFDR